MTDSAPHAAVRSRSNRSLIDRVARRLVWRRLETLDEGRLTMDDGAQCRQFGRSTEGSLAATIEIRDPRFDRVCRKLALTADDHVLEIGSGWGGFAVRWTSWSRSR